MIVTVTSTIKRHETLALVKVLINGHEGFMVSHIGESMVELTQRGGYFFFIPKLAELYFDLYVEYFYPGEFIPKMLEPELTSIKGMSWVEAEAFFSLASV